MTDTVTTSNSIAMMAAALRRGDVTAVELTRTALSRISTLNPQLNAFVLVDEEGALAAAARADAELADGVDHGPLHGVPVAVKDLIDVAGMPTTCGSASSFGTPRAAEDAEVVTRLRTAGAVIVGKTTLHEFAYGATGDRSAHGPSRNPHDPARISGGSSGGSAVAVAAGMVPLALGTDTAGSVRVPAALCGVVGVKPAFDAIPTGGIYPLAPTLDHVGLFAATRRTHGSATTSSPGRPRTGAGRPGPSRGCPLTTSHRPIPASPGSPSRRCRTPASTCGWRPTPWAMPEACSGCSRRSRVARRTRCTPITSPPTNP